MVRTLLNYNNFYGKYTGIEFASSSAEFQNIKSITEPNISSDIPIHAGSVWLTYQALNKVIRPEMEEGWENYISSIDIAWKTGTSYGLRDAWAIGSTPDYVVGVWVGNADGEGRSASQGHKLQLLLCLRYLTS